MVDVVEVFGGCDNVNGDDGDGDNYKQSQLLGLHRDLTERKYLGKKDQQKTNRDWHAAAAQTAHWTAAVAPVIAANACGERADAALAALNAAATICSIPAATVEAAATATAAACWFCKGRADGFCCNEVNADDWTELAVTEFAIDSTSLRGVEIAAFENFKWILN